MLQVGHMRHRLSEPQFSRNSYTCETWLRCLFTVLYKEVTPTASCTDTPRILPSRLATPLSTALTSLSTPSTRITARTRPRQSLQKNGLLTRKILASHTPIQNVHCAPRLVGKLREERVKLQVAFCLKGIGHTTHNIKPCDQEDTRTVSGVIIRHILFNHRHSSFYNTALA